MVARKRLAIVLAVTVVAVVAAVLATVLSLVLPGDAGDTFDRRPVTYDELLGGKFRPKGFSGTWWSSDHSYVLASPDTGDLVLWDVETNQTSTLVSKATIDAASGDQGGPATFVSFAPNQGGGPKYLLFKKDSTPVWRHSFEARYLVLDGDTNRTYDLAPMGSAEGSQDRMLRYAQWRPNYAHIVYVYNNNVYLRKDVTDESGTRDLKLSTSGTPREVYNGVPDWVYEEEVLSSNKAMYFSSSGNSLAYMEFRDNDIKYFTYQEYGSPSDVKNSQYAKLVALKYPKAGTTNPTVNLKVVKLSGPTSDESPPTEVLPFRSAVSELIREEDIVVTSGMQWNGENQVLFSVANRIQNRTVIVECNEAQRSWTCRAASVRDTPGWEEPLMEAVYIDGGTKVLEIRPQSQEVQSSGRLPGSQTFAHLTLVFRDQNHLEQIALTRGEFNILSILGYDESNDTVYCLGTKEGLPSHRHLYRVSGVSQVGPPSPSNGSEGTDAKIECITCEFDCHDNSAQLSPDFKYFTHTCKGPSAPITVLRTTADPGQVKQVLADNRELEDQLAGRTLPEKRYLFVDLPGDEGFRVPVRLSIPAHLDEGALKKYPLLVYVYGGPGSQQVTQRWAIEYEDYLGSNYDVVVARIDGRGTGFQSAEYAFQVRDRLGTVEIEDQHWVTRQLLEQHPFLDPGRVSIWGWSYGGYATLMALAQDDEGLFSCGGISVAPPTDWLLYDSVYTERYMGLPEDNPEGYNRSSLLLRAESLRGKRFMLNHGNADDNVHYQNSMLLVRALEQADVQFEQNSYPDENHGIRSLSRHLYHNMEIFLSQCFRFKSSIPSPSSHTKLKTIHNSHEP